MPHLGESRAESRSRSTKKIKERTETRVRNLKGRSSFAKFKDPLHAQNFEARLHRGMARDAAKRAKGVAGVSRGIRRRAHKRRSTGRR